MNNLLSGFNSLAGGVSAVGGLEGLGNMFGGGGSGVLTGGLDFSDAFSAGTGYGAGQGGFGGLRYWDNTWQLQVRS